MSAEEAEAIMGADTFNGSNAYTATKGDASLTVILEANAVSSIQYHAELPGASGVPELP